MADQTNQTHERHDEPDRPKAARGVSLAEEGSDDLPALLVIAVGIAVIVVLLLQSGMNVPGLTGAATVVSTGTDDGAGAETGDEAGEDAGEDPAEGAEEDAEEDPAEGADEDSLDLDAIGADLVAAGFTGVAVSADGTTLTATGEVVDEATRDEIIGLLEGLPGVESVTDELTIAPASSAAVMLTASQATLVMTGTVPSQAIADELAARALTIYAADQIDNQLVVDASAQPPIVVTIGGATTDQALFDRLTSGFAGIVGIDTINTEGLVLEESSDLEAQLLALAPIQFASGSAVILPESNTILDQAAGLLSEDPSLAIEISGHTDSRGSTESNQTLSQDRANAVLAALADRGVVNDMTPRGFGENRLKVTPDDTPEAQQTNRRIEFRIL